MKAKSTNPVHKIYIILLLMVFAISIGVTGFVVIEQYTFLDALYMTIVTVSTVGYAEVHPLSSVGKVFNMGLIVTNLGLFTYFISTFTSFFLDGEFRKHLKQRKMERSINALRGHVILCGYGRNGKAAAAILEQHNRPFVVLEKHHTEKATAQYYLNHDATTEEALIHAGIHKASALITTLPQDAENLYIVLTARELNPAIKIISRASDDNAVKKMKTAGADNVIMPDKIGGAHMATLITNPDVKEFMDVLFTQGLDGTIIQELPVSKSITLSELDPWRNTGATVLGIKNASSKYTTNPAPTEMLAAGDRVMAMGTTGQIAALGRLLA